VQDRSLLRDVDLLPSKHGVDPAPQTRFLGQLKEELEGFVGDAILRIVEVQAHSLQRHPLAALGIIGEEIAEM
jgi:hypothetical protein